jgi:adenylate cyclase
MAAIWGFFPPLEAIPNIKKHCRDALESDPSSAISYARLASSAMILEWDWDEAKRNLRQAMVLDANDPYIKFVQAQWYLMCGNEAKAIACIEESIALDPLNLFHLWMSADFYYTFHHEDRAEDRLNQILELDPGYSEALRLKSILFRRQGKLEQALELAERVYAIQHGGVASPQTLALVHISMGNEAEARRVLRDVLEITKTQYVLAAVPAFIYAGLGEMDKGFEWLEKAYQEHDQGFRLMKVARHWDTFRPDPRFDEFVRRMNFPAGDLEQLLEVNTQD